MQFGQQTKQGMNKKMSCAALIELLLAWSNKAAVKWTRSSRQTEIELPSLNVVKIYLNLFLICVHMRCICSRSFPSQFRMAFFLQLFAAWRFFAKTYKKRIWKKSKKSGKSKEWKKRWMTKTLRNDKREFDIETYHSTGNQSDIWLGEENMIVKIFFLISFLVFPAQCLISCSFQFNSVPIVLEKNDVLLWEIFYDELV